MKASSPLPASPWPRQVDAGSDIHADPFLSKCRLRPDTWFGLLSRMIDEELGEDAQEMLGQHADTMALISADILQTPKGETGFRALLRHLRDLLARSPGHNRELLGRVARAEAEAAARTQAATQAEEVAVQLRAEVASLRFELQDARAACAAVGRDAEQWAAGMTRSLEGALADQWGQRRREATRAEQVLRELQDRLQLEARERARLGAELAEAHRGLAERDARLAGLSDSLRVGAQWLGAQPPGQAPGTQAPFMMSALAAQTHGGSPLA